MVNGTKFYTMTCISKSSLSSQKYGSVCVCVCVCLCVCFICSVMSPWTIPCQAPMSMGFPRQEYGSELPCLSPGDLPDSGGRT